MPASFVLQFPESELAHYASRYDYPDGDRLNKYYDIGRVQGFLSKDQFLDMVSWKSKRRLALAESNSSALIEHATARAYASSSLVERLRALTALPGVGSPTASVLLHFGADHSEPIVDRRALWSLGYPQPPAYYSNAFWKSYVRYCRDLAERNNVSVRLVDKALWSYSRIHQTEGPAGGPCQCG